VADPGLGDGSLWWKLATVITCGTLAGAIIPEFVKVFTSTESAHVREVVTSAREAGPRSTSSRDCGGQLQRVLARHGDRGLMGSAYLVSRLGMATS